jgi:hypothetical protein
MKGRLAPKRADWERKGAAAPFGKALENKKSSEITLQLNSYDKKHSNCLKSPNLNVFIVSEGFNTPLGRG